ncbi:hypothetical protein HMPREF1860_01756 [Prevotella amnii]|uniref:Uncharacterized protein n=1 Tax=Prevotella amnii TaxID=419005 RepID=A0A134B709_9BACT|nr:hypothetical protein HMPREF1860_01756 [Prevotella amnii]
MRHIKAFKYLMLYIKIRLSSVFNVMYICKNNKNIIYKSTIPTTFYYLCA